MKSIVLAMAVSILAVAPGCGEGGSTLHSSGGRPGETLTFPEGMDLTESFAGEFYSPVPFTSLPQMPAAGLPFETGQVFNLESLALAAGLGDMQSLLSNGFVVWRPDIPTDDPLTAYGRMENWNQPVYISAGIPLHMLHIFFDQILQSIEEEKLYDDLTEICSVLYGLAAERENWLTAAYFAVPLSFLDPDFVPHGEIAGEVSSELALIEAHGGFDLSPVFGYREDYSQYVPRGHYTASARLENYFRAMMWLGRRALLLNGGEPHGQGELFVVPEEAALAMTASALEIVSDMDEPCSGGGTILEKWSRIYEVTAFFAGFADDLSVPEYSEAACGIIGGSAASDSVWSMDFYTGFRELVNSEYAPPAIYSGTGELVSMPDGQGDFDPGDLQEAFSSTTGFRFLGQRYTPDSEILGKLVFPAVGAAPTGVRRFMPTGLDVAAAFGSETALGILEERGDLGFSFYIDSLQSMREMIDACSEEDWHATLYMSWLHSLYLLQTPRGEGYADFMQTEAWRRHTLSNFLASWAMLRHDTILYAKQSYTMEAGCAPMDEPVPSAGFVEPVPEVYAELKATLLMAKRGLEHYGLLDRDIEIRFDNAVSLLGRLQGIAERELSGEGLTVSDADFLKGFASSLESAIAWGGVTEEGLETSLIADVHTDQNSSSVLEVASGDLDWCLVIYMRPDGILEAASGPVLSYYEFTWPMSDRLTDEAWRDILTEEPPERPGWTGSYILE